MLFYTEFLKAIDKPDSESAMEAYRDLEMGAYADPSFMESDVSYLYDEGDYNWIDEPITRDLTEITSGTRDNRLAYIPKERAKNKIVGEFGFEPCAVTIRGNAYYKDERNSFIRFEAGSHALVYADGCLYEALRGIPGE